jgi:effector-binding domain-containing protein
MSKLNVSKSIEINAPAEKIRAVLSDFNLWQAWSPWLIAEPAAKVNVSQDGKSYDWQGRRVGHGEMQVIEENEHSINYDLKFLKPHKSKAKTAFHLRPNGNSTKVEWTMNSGWPFFLFFMRKQMEGYIGMDYLRGLTMLKEYLEKGKISSQLEFLPPQEFEGCDYLGYTKKIDLDDIESFSQKAFTSLYQWAGENDIEITGDPFSQYHKWDVVNKKVHLTLAIPVNEIIENIPEGSKTGSLPKMTLHTVRHHGSYDHLGNAWSTIMMQQRNKEFKAIKSIHPLEFYRTDPEDTAPKDLITDVCFAVK